MVMSYLLLALVQDIRMPHDLGEGYELDDDRGRVDVDAVHRYLSGESYWAQGRPYEVTEQVIRDSYSVVGLYHHGALVGFCRVVSDGAVLAYLADVYVLDEHRGRGLGVALVREAVVNGPPARRWLLHTRDAHPLYAKFGFGPPSDRVMELDVRNRRDPLGEPELPLGEM
jgi:GNAT superfamily N-acetyltransferase